MMNITIEFTVLYFVTFIFNHLDYDSRTIWLLTEKDFIMFIVSS